MLIAVAHGSRNPVWRASVERFIESIQDDLPQDGLRLAYMEFAQPTLRDVVSDVVRQGITKVRILPLFLASEGHVNKDIRPLVEQIRIAFSSLEVELLPPLGEQPRFRDMLRDIVTET